MRSLLITFLLLIASTIGYSQLFNTDITGTYHLNKHIDIENDYPIESYFGNLQVVPWGEDSVILNFYINKGHPSYNTGSFIDTLLIENEILTYQTTCGTNCKVQFSFYETRVHVKSGAEDTSRNCCFGYGVVVNDYYEKTSDAVPILVDPLTGDRLR